MYIIRRIKTTKKGTTYSFKIYSGWAGVSKDGVLDLSDVQRYTGHEHKVIELPPNEEFLWYGCYPELTDETKRKSINTRNRGRPKLRVVRDSDDSSHFKGTNDIPIPKVDTTKDT